MRRSRLTAPLLAALLASCSGTVEQTLDDYLPKREPLYKQSRSLPPLEVPPDLNSSTINDNMVIPPVGGAGSATYSEYAGAAQTVAARGAPGVLPELDNARVERNGDKRWLVVAAPPGQVWPKARDFWLSQGFIIEMEDASIGIMETDWLEQRSRFRPGLIRGLLSRLSSALYGSAVRDRFRTRLEHGAQPGTTEIYISHRGAEEVAVTSQPTSRLKGDAEEHKVWQPRPADPELEAEMLNRLMVFFGVEPGRAQQIIAQSERNRASRAEMVRDDDGRTLLSLSEDFSRAWRRTGLALDRVGFTVEDRDRSRGLYFVRYADPDRAFGDNEGFFSKLKFWQDERPQDNEYLISLIGKDASTDLVVLNKQGERESSETADRILGLLHQQLR